MKSRMTPQGFTLIEVMIATILIGMAVAALVGANAAHTMVNDAGARLSTAEFLLEQIRERTATMPVVEPGTADDDYSSFGIEADEDENDPNDYDDVDDFDGDGDGTEFSPPIDASANELDSFSSYIQAVTVHKVDPNNFQTSWTDATESDFVQVNVDVSYNGTVLSSASWIRARY